jgi:hypothetical protein
MTRILQLTSLAILLCLGTVAVHAQGKEPQVQVPPKNLSQNDGLMHTERQKIQQREAEDRAERKARKEAKEAKKAKEAADHKKESPEDRLVEEKTDKAESK